MEPELERDAELGAVLGPRKRLSQDSLLRSLVESNILSEDHANEVRSYMASEGGWAGQILTNRGYASRLEVFQHWATCLGMPFVDLIADPPDRALFHDLNPALMLQGGWTPWRLNDSSTGRTLLVATSNPDLDLASIAHEIYGANQVEYSLTTDWDVLKAVSACAGEVMAHMAAEDLATSQPALSASRGPSRYQVAFLFLVAALMISAMAWNRFVGLDGLLSVLNVYFDLSIATKLVFSLVGAREVRLEEEQRLNQIIRDGGEYRRRVRDVDLPLYTILIPCYREANIIPQVLKNMEALDYPRSKIQVLLLLEADDEESIEAAKQSRTPDFMRIVVVPDGLPRTKARACNVGLSLATGEFLVIYDAEDRPEAGQLRDIVDRFDELGPEFVCLQARLNYFNARQNFLTRMFTLEYSLWFDYLLLGVDKLSIPMPLGGTSNHFRTTALRTVGGWDPYNVTEDADLGIRCMALGYRVGAVSSTTWEEACPEVKPWIRQRTRWIKGYMMTTIVHTRNPLQLRRTTGWRGVVSIILFIGGTPATFLINPIVLLWGLYGIFGLPIPNFKMIGLVTAFNTFSLIFGSLSMIALSVMATRRRRQWSLIGYAFFNPVYWLLHSWAAWRALIQLIHSPSEWEKTPHGLSTLDEVTGAEGAGLGDSLIN